MVSQVFTKVKNLDSNYSVILNDKYLFAMDYRKLMGMGIFLHTQWTPNIVMEFFQNFSYSGFRREKWRNDEIWIFQHRIQFRRHQIQKPLIMELGVDYT